MAEQTWETVPGTGAPFYKFKANGDTIAGKVIGKRQIPGMEGKLQDVVDLMTKDGEYTIGLTTDLKTKFAKIDIGKLVKVTFAGTKPIKGKAPMKLFDVAMASV